ncbi:hypothetical protein PHMEG_00024590 [Phytophthora megakarya]|uniref:Reverse transcriptase/retrotransposon-derived protein RNase H-like domain-containing protein n=1 Tax=Phytophthora megakarya TaxID=4795 RepID=A0A225VDR7_9STRA|nr:hypothetical protein PHMEG_00024590 [Phytophthora megakarya]
MLRYPDFRLPFCYLLMIGLGASLLQNDGDGWRSVAYASKVNNEAETKYGITELECLTVVGYDLDEDYRPGNINVVADALSRAPLVYAVRAADGRRRNKRRRAPRLNVVSITATAGGDVADDGVDHGNTSGGRDSENNFAKERRQRREHGDTVQLTDEDITDAQVKSKMVQKLIKEGEYMNMYVTKSYGLAVIETPDGIRVLLPPALWALAFKECHDSI